MRDDPEAAEVVRSTLRDMLPAVAGSLETPEGTDAGVLGVTTEELREFALKGLTRRMNIIGVPLDSVWQPA